MTSEKPKDGILNSKLSSNAVKEKNKVIPNSIKMFLLC